MAKESGGIGMTSDTYRFTFPPEWAIEVTPQGVRFLGPGGGAGPLSGWRHPGRDGCRLPLLACGGFSGVGPSGSCRCWDSDRPADGSVWSEFLAPDREPVALVSVSEASSPPPAPNPRLQRTGLRLPLSRKPLGVVLI